GKANGAALYLGEPCLEDSEDTKRFAAQAHT
ncbi:MAG: hypothetical protein ACI841_000457, partial [Planctomycetota bacterium]